MKTLTTNKWQNTLNQFCWLAGLIKIKAPYELIDKEIKELQSFQNKY